MSTHREVLGLLWEEGSRCFFTQELQETMRALADGLAEVRGVLYPAQRLFLLPQLLALTSRASGGLLPLLSTRAAHPGHC